MTSLTRSARSRPLLLAAAVTLVGVALAGSLLALGAANATALLVLSGYAALAGGAVYLSARADALATSVAAPERRRSDERPHTEQAGSVPSANGETAGALGGGTNGDARREANPADPALRDRVTSLATRTLLRDRIEHALARAHRHGRPLVLVVLDIDGFRAVNDAAGYAAGDQLLAAVATRLGGALRAGDTAARIGADEFAILLEDMGDERDFIPVTDRFTELLARPITVGRRELTLSAAVGIARATPDDDADDLMRNADAALVAAKRRGRGACEIFSVDMRASLADQLDLETDLRCATESMSFELHYQPIVILQNRRIAGIEALVRWKHPLRGDIPPSVFIPIADEIGLAPVIGRWVLTEACRQTKAWQEQLVAARSLTVTVNLSRTQLRHPSLVDDVRAALRVSSLDPHRLVLEISDRVILADGGETRARLHALKALGVRIAIDDFGARHAALQDLPRVPVDILKIDKSFVDRVGQAGSGTRAAHVVVALGKAMRMRTVAKGIEVEAQAAELLRLRCEFGQGTLFSQPLPAAGLGALLRSERR